MSTTRLAESIEGLNSSLALAAGDLWPKKGRPIAAVKGLNTSDTSLHIFMYLVLMGQILGYVLIWIWHLLDTSCFLLS